MATFPPTPRTQLKRLPQRGVYDETEIHAILDEKGKVLDAEAVQGDPALASAALGIVWRSTYGRGMRPGRLQREAFINVKFYSPQ